MRPILLLVHVHLALTLDMLQMLWTLLVGLFDTLPSSLSNINVFKGMPFLPIQLWRRWRQRDSMPQLRTCWYRWTFWTWNFSSSADFHYVLRILVVELNLIRMVKFNLYRFRRWKRFCWSRTIGVAILVLKHILHSLCGFIKIIMACLGSYLFLLFDKLVQVTSNRSPGCTIFVHIVGNALNKIFTTETLPIHGISRTTTDSRLLLLVGWNWRWRVVGHDKFVAKRVLTWPDCCWRHCATVKINWPRPSNRKSKNWSSLVIIVCTNQTWHLAKNPQTK